MISPSGGVCSSPWTQTPSQLSVRSGEVDEDEADEAAEEKDAWEGERGRDWDWECDELRRACVGDWGLVGWLGLLCGEVGLSCNSDRLKSSHNPRRIR